MNELIDRIMKRVQSDEGAQAFSPDGCCVNHKVLRKILEHELKNVMDIDSFVMT